MAELGFSLIGIIRRMCSFGTFVILIRAPLIVSSSLQCVWLDGRYERGLPKVELNLTTALPDSTYTERKLVRIYTNRLVRERQRGGVLNE